MTDARFGGESLGYLFAFANCALFMLYVVFGHRIAQDGDRAGILLVAGGVALHKEREALPKLKN